jgi:hypothetical protein
MSPAGGHTPVLCGRDIRKSFRRDTGDVVQALDAGSFSFRIGIVLRTPRSDKGLCSRWGCACLASPTYATTLSQGGVR